MLVLGYFLLRSIDWLSFQGHIINLRWSFAIISVFTLIFYHAINIARWKYLTQHPTIGYTTFARYYGSGLFSNNFLPTGMGGDVLRVILLRTQMPLSQAAISVTIDRVIGLLGLSLLLVAGIVMGLPAGIEVLISRISTVRYIELFLGLCGLLSIVTIVAWIWLPAFQTKVKQIFQQYVESNQRTLAQVLILLAVGYCYSALALAVLVVAYWYAFLALGIITTPGAAVWLLLIVSLSLLIPVTINGLGIQESLFVLILGYYGIMATPALALALLIRVLQIICSLLGGALFLITVKTRAKEKLHETTYQ